MVDTAGSQPVNEKNISRCDMLKLHRTIMMMLMMMIIIIIIIIIIVIIRNLYSAIMPLGG